jgi:spore coat polysaccharide biosynthesis predicted glycosyltransferase SpsG|tara:strand:+ start:732 stop:983 length:252 start_codon:yes stop_codon:yes gene_type:complete
VVISNAGSTLFELAIQKIPTMCISAVEHQMAYANEFAKKGFSMNLGFYKKIEEENINKILSEVLQNRENLKKLGFDRNIFIPN